MDLHFQLDLCVYVCLYESNCEWMGGGGGGVLALSKQIRS